MAELEWFEDADNEYCWFADVGPFTLNVHTAGKWWIEDAGGAELQRGLTSLGFQTAKLYATWELKNRLRLAAETLDSSWLEAPQPETAAPEPNEPVCTGTQVCRHCHDQVPVLKVHPGLRLEDQVAQFSYWGWMTATAPEGLQHGVLTAFKEPATQSGYSQILDAIKAEAESVKL